LGVGCDRSHHDLRKEHPRERRNGQLALSMSKARKAFDLMKARLLKGLSIGYDIVRSDVKDGVRRLLELKLYEVSLVTLPMNELATVSAVKSEDDNLEPQIRQFQQLLAECRKSWV
jgi:uncharacterized protein